MANNQETKLATRQTGELAVNAPTPVQFDGDESRMLGRMAVYYGSAEERQKYTGMKGVEPGTLIDKDMGRALKSGRFAVVAGWEEWSKWGEKGLPPVYTYRWADRNKIPQEDLKGVEGDDGRWISPPAAVHSYCYVVAVEGEPFPFLFMLNRTAHKSGEFIIKMVKKFEMAKAGIPAFKITMRPDKNVKGDNYDRVVVVNDGLASGQFAESVIRFRDAYSEIKDRAESMTANDTGDDDVPF